LTHRNSIRGQNKSIFNSVQNLLSFRLSSKNIKRTIILPVVFYCCETWSLKLTEERRLRIIEKSVLRRIFGPRGEEVTEEWRKLTSDMLNYLYFSPRIIRAIKSNII